MLQAPHLIAFMLYLLTLLLLLHLGSAVLLGFTLLVVIADVGLLLGVGAHPNALLGLALLGFGSLVTPRERVIPRLAFRRQKRLLLPPSEKEPLEERYQILDKLGTGGMATVYRAKRRADGLIAALKIPQERYANETRFLHRLHREAEVLKRLKHPNIVRVYEHGKAGNTHFISMELVDGPSLDELITERKLSPELTLKILLPVAEALKYMHDQGFLHRDLKPGNIMIYRNAIKNNDIDPSGVRLMDFGIAAGKEFTRLTAAGSRIGTPTYMSPEQARGRPLNEKSDVYSLGVVLYEALVGEAPFQGDFEQVARKQIHERPVPPIQKNPYIHPVLNDLVMRMLDKDPEKRPNLGEVIATLKTFPKVEASPQLKEPLLAVAAEDRGGSLRLINPEGLPVRAFGRQPANDLTVDSEGLLWAVYFEFSGDRGMVRRYSLEGKELLATGTYGLKLGEFFNPISITATPSGHVFILDSESQTITRMTLEGKAELRFGGRGSGRGTFKNAQQIVAREDVFVLDIDAHQVQRLDLEGTYKDRFVLAISKNDSSPRKLLGLGMDASGNLLIYDAFSRKIRTLSLDGKILGSIPLPLAPDEDEEALVDLAGASDGTIYAVRRGSTRVYRLQMGKDPTALDLGVSIRAMDLLNR